MRGRERDAEGTKRPIGSVWSAWEQRGDAISIADMFEMQMMMNHLAQLSEMSSTVVSAANAAITAMAKNAKG
jgi:hypothetical protein